jgi:DNA-binding NarL/FixJ family response regulator
MTTNMAAIVAQLSVLSNAIDQAARERDRLEQLINDAAGTSSTALVYKNVRGGLTEAGVAAISQMLDRGSSNAEIAKFFDISVSAVIYRRSRWDAAQAREAG